MAKVWIVHGAGQGSEPIAVLPWPDCKELLELDEQSRTAGHPGFGSVGPGGRPTHVVVQVEVHEARAHGMAPGFFVSPLPLDEAVAQALRIKNPVVLRC